MTSRKTRFVRKNAKQGIDTIKFELALPGTKLKNLQKQILINKQGFRYGSVEAKGGKAFLILNLPKFIRGNNIMPYTLSERIKVEIIRNDCLSDLEKIFGKNINTQINTVEVNITQEVSGKASVSDVLNFLHNTTCSKNKANKIYEERDMWNPQNILPQKYTVVAYRENYWSGKFYNKSEEVTQKRIQLNLPIDDVPPNLLRIEIVFVNRTIKKIFGNRLTLEKTLTAKNIIEILREYKRVFEVDLIEKRIKPYLTAYQNAIYESLMETNNPLETIVKCKELIIDIELFQRALKKYMKKMGLTNNSARDAKRYAEKYGLPVDCRQTIKDFHMACG